MLLVYDSKCGICRNLAQKFHVLSDRRIEIQPLSSPEAHRVLAEFYPDGWTHDFYVVRDGKCRKGVRALPRLAKGVGVRNMAALMAEYASFKLAAAPNGNGAQRSKRDLLKFAALSPLLLAFSKPGSSGGGPAEDSQAGRLNVHVAEVEGLGAGQFEVRAYRCDDCLRKPQKFEGVPKGSAVHPIEDRTLGKSAVSGLELLKGQTASYKIKRVSYERESVRGGAVSRDVKTIHSSMLEHSRYNVVLSFGQGFRTTAAGMAQHDLPIPAFDYVVFKGDSPRDAVEHFAAYAAGVRELARLHEQDGRGELARVYRDMARGLEISGERFEKEVGRSIVPEKNELVVTSMPELMKFVEKPAHLRATAKAAEVEEGGCDCNCSCGLCCGCGCSLGLCLEPVSPCGCDCCLACGCGCGCCL